MDSFPDPRELTDQQLLELIDRLSHGDEQTDYLRGVAERKVKILRAGVPSATEDLKRVPLFSGLSQRQLRELAKHFRESRLPVGARLVKQGEMSGVAFFVIAEGEAAVILDGRRVATVGPGDHFGELAMISQRERVATVEALTPMRCHTIQFWDLRAFVKKNPEVMWKLLQHVAGIRLEVQSRHAAHAESASVYSWTCPWRRRLRFPGSSAASVPRRDKPQRGGCRRAARRVRAPD